MPATNIAFVGSLLGDETRACIVSALLDGRALTATELAVGAGKTPQTTSFHLDKLTRAGLLQVLPQGRHKFFRISSPDIATAIDALVRVVPNVQAKPAAKRANDVCFARTCYNHLAGYLGVAVAKRLQDKGIIEATAEDDFSVTIKGEAFFDNFEMDLSTIRKGRRSFARQCLDWSERRPHIGGCLGQALCDRLIALRWLSRQNGGREIYVTAAGRRGFKKLFQLNLKLLERTFSNL